MYLHNLLFLLRVSYYYVFVPKNFYRDTSVISIVKICIRWLTPDGFCLSHSIHLIGIIEMSQMTRIPKESNRRVLE